MSLFSCSRQCANYGDSVIVYISPEDISILQLNADAVLQNRLGRFPHSHFVGKTFGSQIWDHTNQKHLQMLRPTPELWTRVLPHRTQIIYVADIAMIIEQLDIGPCSRVLESGTGSGSLTHSLLRAVGEDGHVFSFDFHKERYSKAVSEFSRHGYTSSQLTLGCRDVCTDGFGEDLCSEVIDAVFLDLPSPWLAIPHLLPILLHDSNTDKATRIGIYSPCIEQVQLTIMTLQKHGFVEIEMFECLLRELETEELQQCQLSNEGEYIGKRELKRKREASLLSPSPSSTDADLEGTQWATRTKSKVRGHTSFLYFATLLPKKKSIQIVSQPSPNTI